MLIALTGGIGSGKTTVAKIFQKLGVPVIFADEITRSLVKPGKPEYLDILEYFGEEEITNEDGSINRSKLRDIIFQNEEKRKWLEELLHPLVNEYISEAIKKQVHPYIIVEIPLLLESSTPIQVDRILVTDCPEELQFSRTIIRDNTTPEKVAAIIATQVSRETRVNHCHDIIDNSRTLDSLQKQVEFLHEKYSQYSLN